VVWAPPPGGTARRGRKEGQNREGREQGKTKKGHEGKRGGRHAKTKKRLGRERAPAERKRGHRRPR
jgi:hypothetical protein